MCGDERNRFSALQSWTPEAQAEVEELQIRGYRSLAAVLGLGGDADKAYDYLMRDRALPGKPEASLIWPKLGITPPSDFDARSAIERDFTALYERISKVELPTRYEDPRNYFDMVLLLVTVLDHLAEKATPALSAPLVASLPSGNTNAQLLKFPGVPVLLLFDHGLFRFCEDMANVLAWTVVPLTVEQIADEKALIGIQRVHTIPPEASQYFLGSLYAYVVYGSPIANKDSVPRPASNYLLAVAIGVQMRRFVMAHELAHFLSGHLDERGSKQLEYEADSKSTYIVSEMARGSFGSWAVGFWACDFTLTALHFLYKGLGLMAYGTDRLRWIGETHPDPMSRRRQLRAQASNTDSVTPTNIAAAEAVCGMTDALFARLWRMQSPWLYQAHLNGVRPAPTWQTHVEANLAPAR